MSSVPVQQRSFSQTALQVVKYAVCSVVALLVLIPLVTAVLGGFKTNAALQASPFGWPNPIQLDNYSSVITSVAFWRQLGNSTFVMLITAFGVVLLASMAAFVFAR